MEKLRNQQDAFENNRLVDWLTHLGLSETFDFSEPPTVSKIGSPLPILELFPKSQSFFFPLSLIKMDNFISQSDYLLSLSPPKRSQTLIVGSETNVERSLFLIQSGFFDSIFDKSFRLDVLKRIIYFFSDPHQSAIFKNYFLEGIEFTKTERQIVECLLENLSQGVTRELLMKRCWKNTNVYFKTLDVHIFNLRRKLRAFSIEIEYANSYWKLKRI